MFNELTVLEQYEIDGGAMPTGLVKGIFNLIKTIINGNELKLNCTK